ncbi:maleate isomerase/arylmalonate decarboxylase [Ruegeria halocynthiae]|uniref:Maleate isomerase/arylmalonate decarboxylase n=1 Tax=Ruegeria halocynthiae TaxID=985054 RepID=A0A1H2Z117_9RHOB|nr:Asp/Glu racemase [Ruegeria halocynthiae]SDX10594.1 maleate isomerase/arylmalonate decarboxylase [Ruegeria halocynthiae]
MTQSRGRARFGILVPFTNTNLEPDMALLRPDGVSMHFARMGGYDRDEIPDADQMHGLGAADLDEPLHLLQGVRPDVILYGCTSATLTHGPAFDRALAERIKVESGAETVTAAGALVHALQTLGVTRIGFASPYVSAINDMAIGFLAETGVETVARSEVGYDLDNYGQGDLDPQAVFDLGLAADRPEAGAIVLSCTDMRSVEIISRLEQAVGKPVISSNQAMMFQAKQLAGIRDTLPGYGQVLERGRL